MMSPFFMLTFGDLNPKSKLNAHFGQESHIAATSIQESEVQGTPECYIVFFKSVQMQMFI